MPYKYSQQSLTVLHVLHAVQPKTSDLLLTLGSAPHKPATCDRPPCPLRSAVRRVPRQSTRGR
jgi:hypothetical protein